MPDSTSNYFLSVALQHHQAGRLREAEQGYRQVLQANPGHAFAMHNLGIIAGQIGNYPAGIELLRRAITLNPSWPEARANLGKMLTDAGQLDAAADACRQAIAINSNCAEAHNNLGVIFRLQRRIDESIASARQAIAIRPHYPEAFTNLSASLVERGEFAAAIAAAQQAIALSPQYAEAHNNLGHALKAAGKLEEAVVAYRQAIQLNPQLSEAHYNLGVIFADTDRLDEAISQFRRAIELKPNFADAHYNLANAFQARAQYDEALNHYRSALAIQPDHKEARYALGTLRLLRGEFAQGWPEFEWRSKLRYVRPPELPQPRWDGSPLNGRTILLHADFGHGDSIQFVRYWPLVQAKGGQVIVHCHPSLKRFFQISIPSCQIIGHGEPLPPFDCHYTLMSLPHIFATDLSSIPSAPYLHADPQDIAVWQNRITQIPHPRVGLVWQGNFQHINDRNRSIPLSLLEPLAQIADINFINLQKGPAADAIKTSPIPLTDFTPDLHDFADTAALISNLDLVIAVDTALAHLTGSLGKPVWTLLPLVPDWRWMLDRPDCPWYPTMRLFRQRSRGDWPGVIENVAAELQQFLAEQSS